MSVQIPRAARGPLLVAAVVLTVGLVVGVVGRWAGADGVREVGWIVAGAGLGVAALIFGAWGISGVVAARRRPTRPEDDAPDDPTG